MTNSIQAPGAGPAPTAAQSAPAKASNGAAAAGSSSQFLKMLVAQLKNQDPLNPMDNAQITSQMAQLSTVDGINQLNATLAAMSQDASASQSLQAASLVGKHVMIAGNALQLSGGQATGGYTLSSAADKVTVSVSGASGEVVYTAALGAQPAGLNSFIWDGKTASGASAVDGNYTFTVSASAGGESVNASALTIARVDGVTPTETGTSLKLGGMGNTPLASVQFIY